MSRNVWLPAITPPALNALGGVWLTLISDRFYRLRCSACTLRAFTEIGISDVEIRADQRPRLLITIKKNWVEPMSNHSLLVKKSRQKLEHEHASHYLAYVKPILRNAFTYVNRMFDVSPKNRYL